MKGYAVLVEAMDFTKKPVHGPGKDYIMVLREETERDYPIPSAFSAFTKYLDIKPGMGKRIEKK